MIWIFVPFEAVEGGRLSLAEDEARHVGGSLRARPGEELVAVTPDGVAHRSKVTAASPIEVTADILSSEPASSEPRTRARLAVALLKGDQFERILEYAAEMGVDSVQPLLTKRIVARLDPSKADNRLARWRQILRQGAELGRRGRIPDILPPATPDGAIWAATRDGMTTYVLFEGAGLPSLSGVELDPARGVAILVGPEGGWDPAEIQLAEQRSAVPVTLGPRIMRPLPAALTALAVVLHRAGELELPQAT